jgi:FKBP-type peptidyl-prolyl cis-trans isomerase
MTRISTLLLVAISLIVVNISAASSDSAFAQGGIKFKDLVVGTGAPAEVGDVAVMHFVGWIAHDGQRGREFFNTRSRGRPASFVVGTDRVMQGWNEGVIGMRAGGRRLLLVPPGLAYGEKGVQGIVPANAPLMFLIEMLEVEEHN